MKKYFSSYWIRSAFYSFLQRSSITFFGFLNFAILARSLSQTQMGTWGLFLIITSVFESAKSNLLKNAHIKYVSSSNEVEEKTIIASSSLLINIAITIIAIILILLLGGWLSELFNTGPELKSMLYWFIPGLIFMVYLSHFEAIQQSHLDFRGGFAGHLVRQVSFFGVIVYYIFSNTPISMADLAKYQSLTVALGAITLFIFSKKYMTFQFRPTKEWVKKIVGYGRYIFGSGMVATVSAGIDQMMTAKVLTASAVPFYSIAARINLLVDIPSYAAAEIIFPKASRASVEEGKERVKYLFEKMVAVLIAFTIPTAIVIIILPKLFTIIIGGKAYMAAALIVQLYMIAGILRPAQNQAANLLNSIGKTRKVFVLNTVYLVALLLMNYLCLKEFGFYGAAIGTLTTSMLNFLMWYFVMRKEIDLNLTNVFSYMIGTYQTIFRKIFRRSAIS